MEILICDLICYTLEQIRGDESIAKQVNISFWSCLNICRLITVKFIYSKKVSRTEVQEKTFNICTVPLI